SGDTGNYETSHYSNLHMQENNKGKDFNILGYKIYEEEKGYVNYVEGENNTYYEDDVVAVGTEYTYWATAVYEQGEGGESNTDSAIPYISGGWHDDFTQNWSTTGKWSLDPASPNNWEYDGTNQCAKLTWSPSTTNYDMSLVSEEFTLPSDPADVFDLTVSMYINDYSTDSGEMMEIWIIHGGDETMVFQWDLDDNDDWGVSGGQDWVYSDTDQFAGETVQIKLRSHGGDTFNFNYWYVYDVLFDYAGTAPDYGALAGVVTDGDGTPIEGAEVKADVAKYNPVYTNEDGEYEIDPMKVGTYDVTYTATGYTTIVEEDVVIEADQTTTLDVVLGSPTMEIDPTTIDATVPVGGVDSTYITITNNGDAPLYWNATLENVDDSGISYNVNYNLTGSAAAPGVNDSRKGPGNGVYVPSHGEDMWDILYNFNDTDAGNPGIETNGEYIYTSDWRAGETTFHEFDMDGNFVQEFNISGATQIRDMAYDGEYFYGAAADMSLKKMDLPNQQLVETINASCSGVTGIRHIAFDPMLDGGNGGFWIGNWDGLGAIDKDGNQIYSNVGPGVGSLYGSAYDPITDGGPYLWLFSQEGSGVQLTQFEIASQSVTGVTHDANDIPGFISGSIAGGAATYITNDGLFALLVNIQQDPNLIGCYELGQVSTWIQIDPTTGTVDPGGSTQQVKVKFDAGEDPAGTVHTADVVFESPQGVPSVTTQVNLLVVPPTSGTLEGIVTDSDSNPIENATVTAGSYQATTNASGEYTMDDIATGTYDVYASHASYNTSAPATVEILEDQTTTQDFALTQPTMEVTPTTIEEFVHPDNPVSVDVTVANNGDGPLNYYVDLIRGVQTDYSNCSSGVPASEKGQIGSNNSDGFVAENTSKDDVTLHYDGPNDDNGIGLTDGGTFMVAARFTSDELDDYYGDYQLSNVEIFIWDTPTNATLKVWEGGSMGDPGTEIYSDDITSQVSQESWSTITLNTPIELIADNEYWVGYEVTHAAGDYPAGCDAGPAVDGKGDWIYLDPGPWDEIQNMGLDINWNIRAVLSPGMVPWITFSPDSGYVEAGDEDIVTVDFNTVDHSIGEVLVAQLHFSSMPDVGTQDVNIQVTVGDMEATGQTEVTETALNSSFPNPFTDHTTISFSLKQPTNVKLSVYNVKGQLVQTLLNEHMDKGEYNVDWNADNRRLGTGIYFYKLETENKSFLKKMIMIK
ncbi:MAG: carboxypeptidase regulatory-like domain-containing protein, partial [Candidatus Cloacimonetes bacterium]|nr:carboxypeptidase regulatory-like domain-containing protein [Candidatus Cloacimonadota bacterium]